MPTTTKWTARITARSSIAHGGETRGLVTLLRRELILDPTASTATPVPILSGNGLRGRLRRIGEELLRDTLHYEGQLPLAAAHALRGGGALTKVTGEPLSGRRLHTVRDLIPQLGIFGAAAGGRIIDGCLQVGKIFPHFAETAHLLDDPPTVALRSFDSTQIETYSRRDDHNTHGFADLTTIDQVPVIAGQPDLTALEPTGTEQLARYRIETFPAGTQFSTWLRLDRATDRELAFFHDILTTYTADARIGGRAAIGHGHITLNLTQHTIAGTPPNPLPDWREPLLADPAAALQALTTLT